MSEEPIHKFNLRLPERLYKTLAAEAEEAGVSVNAYFVAMLQLVGTNPERFECDHEPYIASELFEICYRCGTPLTAHRT